MSISSLVDAHEAALLKIFVTLGSDEATPRAIVDTRIADLRAELTRAIGAQQREAQAQLDSVQANISEALERGLRMRRELGEDAVAVIEAHSGAETLLQRLSRLRGAHSELEARHQTRTLQLDALYARLRQAIDVLGKETIGVEVPAEGSSLSDLRVETLQRLEEEAQRCDTEIERAQNLLQAHLVEIEQLWATLGNTVPQPCTPSALDVSATTFPGAAIAHLTPDIDYKLVPCSSIIALAESTRTDLEAELSRREQEIQRLYDELYILWARMDISEEEQDAFVEQWKGTEQASIDAYRAEHARMIELRAANMLIFIERERADLIRICDELYLAPEERPLLLRAEVQPSEAALEAHEQERQRLELIRAQRAPVLDLVARYAGLLQEAADLEASASDPNRFKGTRGDPGRLLREEKQRKRIAKERPKLEADLMQVVPAWEAEHGLAFTVNGSRYLDELAATLAPVRIPRSKTPAPGDRAKTPAPGDRARTPGPGERSKTPGPGDRARTPALQPASTVRPVRAQHTGGASIGLKRQQTGNDLSTPASSWSDSSVKRPRTQSISASKVPMPASWGLPADHQQSARTTFRPRPSAVSTASSIFSARTVSSATSIDSIDVKPA